MEQRDPRDKSEVGSQRCQYQRCPRLLFCLLGLLSLLGYKTHLQLLFALLCRAVEYARNFIASIIRAVENKTL